MKNRLFNHFSVLALWVMIGLAANAQNEPADYEINFSFSTTKQTDNSRVFEVKFVGQNEEDRKDQIPVYGAEVVFYNMLDTTETKLGVAKTDKEGHAQILLPANFSYLTDDFGYMNFKAEFSGNDDFESQSSELAIRDVFIEMTLEVVDSVYTVTITAETLDSTKARVAMPTADVILSVGGMISRMPIAEETLEEGSIEIEFPYDIPGDKNGMIDVFFSIEESEEYGSVLLMKPIKWGSVDNKAVAKPNQLWSEAAPFWMYIVLSILLIGVWANYVYSAFNLFKIKKEGQLTNPKADEKE